MGRIGIGPDDGDGGFEWSCPRCNYPNPGGASNCMDCGYSGSSGSSGRSHNHSRCTCECPVHGKQPREYRERRVKEKPLTKKEKAQIKRFLESMNKKFPVPFALSLYANPKPKKRKTSKKKK